MSAMMIRLLSTISLAVVAILGADISATPNVGATKAETPTDTQKGSQAADAKIADPVVKKLSTLKELTGLIRR